MHLPANTFSARHESCGEDTANSRGTTLTGGSANAEGSWVTLKSATSFAYEGITIYCFLNSGNNSTSLIDIGIDDGAGNVFTIVENLEYSAYKHTNEHNLQMCIPVHVPAGVELVARVQNSFGAATLSCLVIGHSANPGGFPGYSRAVALFTSASSRGVNIDPGGSANTKGAWAELTSSCPVGVVAIFGVVGFDGDVVRAGAAHMLLDIGVGAASSEFVILSNISMCWGSVWDGPNDVFFQPVAAQIATGTRVVARAQCSVTTDGDRDVDLALYGLVS